MKVTDGNIYEILNRCQQFVIPIYQRSYSWNIEHCDVLWNDIVRMQQYGKSFHFVGSIVNITEQVMPMGVQKFTLIDGQQRLTTLSLLMIALRNHAMKEHGETGIDPVSIDNSMLKNTVGQGDDIFKLLLTGEDKKIFCALVNHLEDNLETGYSKLLKNYHFFEEKLRESPLPLAKIYEAIGKLLIVNITLDRESDDAQAIFESLNSTGKGLSASDLIRNYVLMGLAPAQQNEVYEKLWCPMEAMFEYENQTATQDRFLRDYLTMKRGRIPRQNSIYDDFKRFAPKKDFDSIKALCTDMKEHARYYTNIVYQRSQNNRLQALYKDIRELHMEVAYPFLLQVHHDCTLGKISENELIEIVSCCINYVFRRSICDIPTNSLNKTFASMKNSIRENDYLNSVKAAFILLESYKVFPKDDVFVQSFKNRDIYHTRNLSYILRHLEDYDNKGPITIENYTIEHIMPQTQNMSAEWKAELGNDWKEIQRTKLHTIGNLTLTAYNSEMGAKSFANKSEMDGGFKQSALRLNRYIVQQSHWGLEQIEERADILAGQALKIWGYPSLPPAVLQAFTPAQDSEQTYELQDYNFSPVSLELYNKLDKRLRNLSPEVKRECKKLYIAYKLETNFVDIVVQQTKLRLTLNLKFEEIFDPHHLCQDVTEKGKWGNGDVRIDYSDSNELDVIMDIIKQSYHKQADTEGNI